MEPLALRPERCRGSPGTLSACQQEEKGFGMLQVDLTNLFFDISVILYVIENNSKQVPRSVCNQVFLILYRQRLDHLLIDFSENYGVWWCRSAHDLIHKGSRPITQSFSLFWTQRFLWFAVFRSHF